MLLATLNPMVPFILPCEVGNVCRKAFENTPRMTRILASCAAAMGGERSVAEGREGFVGTQDLFYVQFL